MTIKTLIRVSSPQDFLKLGLSLSPHYSGSHLFVLAIHNKPAAFDFKGQNRKIPTDWATFSFFPCLWAKMLL
jgi:hypothetical protein